MKRTSLVIAVGWLSGVFGFSADYPVSDADRAKIEAMLPAKAPATPSKPRKLLIFDLNVGYPGHGSIGTANIAFTLMGAKTGAFTTTVRHDPAVFKPDSLAAFDAVFFNNTVGNCFEDAALRQSLAEFVYRGGGLLGCHGTTVGFTRWPGAIEDWPEFGIMIGGRGARHRVADERVVFKFDSPDHPLNRCFGGKDFEYRSEFFRVDGPYSRDRVRVLFSIDTKRTELGAGPRERQDDDYALAWVRSYGRGRTCYCTIAHAPADFQNTTLLEFWLAAAQFVLGDLPAPTTPSAKLTPAVLAQEKLGWRVALASSRPAEQTFFELVARAAALGVGYVEGSSAQRVDAAIPGLLDAELSADARRELRLKLDAAGVRLLSYRIELPLAAAATSHAARFARDMGMERVVAADVARESASPAELKAGAPAIIVIQDVPDAADRLRAIDAKSLELAR